MRSRLNFRRPLLPLLPVLLCALFSLSSPASEEPAWAAGLPAKVARIGTREIDRAEAIAITRRRYPETAIPAAQAKLYVRDALQDEFCRMAAEKRLREAGFAVSEAEALDFYRRRQHLLPERNRFGEEAMRRLAADPDNRLLIAIQLYMQQRHPERLKVTDRAVEDFYRRNQDKFQPPPELKVQFIRVARTPAGKLALENARAELLQGGDWAAVAARTGDPVRSAAPPPALPPEALPAEPGRISAVIELAGEYLIARRQRVAPAASLTLEQATPEIRQLLIDQSIARELEKMITEELGRLSVEYYW